MIEVLFAKGEQAGGILYQIRWNRIGILLLLTIVFSWVRCYFMCFEMPAFSAFDNPLAYQQHANFVIRVCFCVFNILRLSTLSSFQVAILNEYLAQLLHPCFRISDMKHAYISLFALFLLFGN